MFAEEIYWSARVFLMKIENFHQKNTRTPIDFLTTY